MKILAALFATLVVAAITAVADTIHEDDVERYLNQVSPDLWDPETRSLRTEAIAALAERQFAGDVRCFTQQKIIPPSFIRLICLKPNDPICSRQTRIGQFCTYPYWVGYVQLSGPATLESLIKFQLGYCLTGNALTDRAFLPDRSFGDICVGLGICWTPPVPPAPCTFSLPPNINFTTQVLGTASNLDDPTGCHATIGGKPCDSCGLSRDGRVEVSCEGNTFSFGPIDFPYTLTGKAKHIPVDPKVEIDYAY